MPISPAFQYNAFVGHALMQSLHSTPQHVRLFTVMLPSAKNSFVPMDAKSSSLRFFFAFSPLLVSKSNMSTLEGLFSGIRNHR
jgi:hypothetical protein